jgi:hypothetical protein
VLCIVDGVLCIVDGRVVYCGWACCILWMGVLCIVDGRVVFCGWACCILWMGVLCIVDGRVVFGDMATSLNTARSQLSVSRRALGALPEDGNLMPKHVGVTIHN